MDQLSSKRDLPEDILEQIILPRLPPKSLVRFMCVSKSWYNLIRSPGFVTKQLSWSKQHNNPSILFRRLINNRVDKFDLLSLVVDGDDDLFSNVSIPLGGMWTKSYQHLQILGHCDGIVCLRLCLGNLVLCNPTIKDFKLVPKSCLILPEEESVTHNHIMRCKELLGFGYDPKGKDYKVIRCVQYGDVNRRRSWVKAEVYNMGTNSWRQINWTYKDRYDRNHPHLILGGNTKQLFFNGIHYWLVHFGIISFDMGDELFHEIPFPLFEFESSKVLVEYYKSSSCLSVWKDETSSIALVTPWQEKTCGHYVNYDIWLLNSFEWTKHLTITTKQLDVVANPFLRHVPLVVLCKSDQLLATKEDGRVVVSYDFSGKERRTYDAFEGSSYYFDHQAVVYVNSLVPVTGGHKLEGVHKSDFYAVERFSQLYESEDEYSKKMLIERCTMIFRN